VFLDETAVATNLTRLRGRSRRDTRCVAHAPHGYDKSTTFIAGLRCDGVSAPLVMDGAMDGAMFVAWVHECLVPSLHAGDVVIADNLSSHTVAGVRQALQVVGWGPTLCICRRIPPISIQLKSCFPNSRPCCARPERKTK